MFKLTTDERLSSWAQHRKDLEQSNRPFHDAVDFWRFAPFIHHNHRIDPHYQRSWPSPWEIIVENQYDDFTKALMIGWTIKATERFKNSLIELKTLVDKNKNSVYNIIVVDNEIAINYKDNEPVLASSIPDSFLIENVIELKRPR